MILATQTLLLSNKLGDLAAVRMLSEAGFDALDYTMVENILQLDHPLRQSDYQAYANELRKEADRIGISFNQAHAPFPVYIDQDLAYNQMIQPLVERSIEVAGILGAKSIVVHPIDSPGEERQKALNLSFFENLQPLCVRYGIKIALENMWSYDRSKKKFLPNVCSTGDMFVEYLNMLDPRYFTACLDLGHCGLVGEDAAQMVRQLGHDRLTALHVHDNDFTDDRHAIPFWGQMDWHAITQALADIRYSGDLTFEVDKSLTRIPNTLIPNMMSYLQATGRHLIQMIESHWIG